MSQRFDDERLLEWLLNPADRDPAAQSELEADADAAARLAELEGLLGHLRSVAGDVQEEADSGPLAARVLERTTREDLSWRGDLALYGRHLRGRLAESGWLRLAAASLLLHLVALPALAVYVLVAEPKAPAVGYLPAEEYRPAAFPEQVEPDPTPPLEDVDGDEDDLEALEDGR